MKQKSGKAGKAPGGGASAEKMSFLRHLTELRTRLVRCAAVLAAAFSLSRAEAARLINQGRALVNQAETLRVDYTVPEHALLSLRGTGRVRLDEIAGETKKGRIALRLFVYGGGK